MTDQGWVKAGELHEGSKVLNSRKEYEVVESIEYKGYNEIEVYNLIVENYHTFFITELGLMVHNIDCKNATLGQIFKQVGDNISDTKIKGDFEDVIKKLDDIAERNNIEEYIKNFDSRFRGLDPNNLDEIKKIISDASKDIDNHSSSLFKGTEGVSKANSKLSGKEVDLEWLSDNYKAVEIEGTVKVNGEIRDISRRVYQTEIDWDYIPNDHLAKGLTNKELALKGKSPYAIDKNGIEAKIELHHLTQVEAGSMVEIVATTHDEYTKILHGLVEKGGSFRNNSILDKQYSNFLKKYWRWRAKNL